MRLLLLLFISCVLYQNVISYKFLAILPIPSKSHYYIGQNLMKGLAEDGHEVTVISPFKEKSPIKNYKEVFLEHTWVESRKCNNLLTEIFVKKNHVENVHLFRYRFGQG